MSPDELSAYVSQFGGDSLIQDGKLTLLHLSSSSITDRQLAELDGLQDVRSFNITKTSLTDRGLACLSQMPKLEGLRLDGTAIDGSGLAHLCCFNTLAKLVLRSCGKFDGDNLRHLAKCSALTMLALDDTPIDDTAMPHISAIRSVRILSLQGTGITDEGFRYLQAMPNLKVVSVSNQISDAARAALEAAIPNIGFGLYM